MSPDSGFIKSPVDSSSAFSSLTTTPVSSNTASTSNSHILLNHITGLSHSNSNNHLQSHQHQQHHHNHQQLAARLTNSDFNDIPNCTTDPTVGSTHPDHHLEQLHQQLGLVSESAGVSDGSEFALKCELVDIHSPYTTAQSADQFLFDGSPDFDGGMVGICVDPGRDLRLVDGQSNHITNTGVMHTHMHLNNNNSNHNNNSSNNMNHNNNNTSNNNMNHNGDFGGGQCHNVFDGMKPDFLSQPSDFLALETQFTDLDSGMTTYTNMVVNSNNNGCMA